MNICEIRYNNSSYSFPQDEGLAIAFPVATILQEARDLYEPQPWVEGARAVGIWQKWCKKTYKPAEHLGILLAMAQMQEYVYHTPFIHANDIMDKFKRQEFEVSERKLSPTTRYRY
jgi:hypothetical protein